MCGLSVYALQHNQAAQRIGLPSARAQKHRAGGPKANDALTIKSDHLMGARQAWKLVVKMQTIDQSKNEGSKGT